MPLNIILVMKSLSVIMSGLLFENNKHTIAKVRENINRHGSKNATMTTLVTITKLK